MSERSWGEGWSLQSLCLTAPRDKNILMSVCLHALLTVYVFTVSVCGLICHYNQETGGWQVFAALREPIIMIPEKLCSTVKKSIPFR